MHLSAEHVPSNLIHPELASRSCIVLSSRMKREQISEFFFGIGFGADFIVRYQSGFEAFRHQFPGRPLHKEFVDGSFLLGEYTDNQFLIRTDPIGVGTIFLWRQGKDWVVSNSLFVMAREIECLGHQPKLYPPALAIFSISPSGRDHGQIGSQNTALEDAILVPSNCALVIEFLGDTPSITTKEIFEFPIRERNRDVYSKELLNFVQNWRDRFYTLRQNDQNLALSLSGGKDSRAVLALLKSSLGEDFYAYTKKNKSADEEIANQLIEKQTSGIRPRPPWFSGRVNCSQSENYAFSLFHYAGVKRSAAYGQTLDMADFFTLSGGAVLDPVTMRGSMAYRVEGLRQQPRIQNEQIREHAVQEYESVYEDLPFDLSDKNAKMYHYAQYRARLHYGNISLSSLSSQLMPFFSWDIFKLALCAPSYRYLLKNAVNYDVMTICAPELMNYPFTGDAERGALVGQSYSLADLPEPRLLAYFCGDPPSSSPDVRRTYGPDASEIIREVFPRALARFGHHFEESFLEAAQKELAEIHNPNKWQQARFLCNLHHLFPEINGKS